ncbi:MAG: DUF3791 domain-containing protein [Lachnospiraceae bacterium]|jgi:hypothetical protein|nr:DUF3791 domain-containing protein [Lachnospiraceae bacterium]
MIANRSILNHKFETVIEAIALEQKIPLRMAIEELYRSQTYKEIREGISDMHCRSDKYLAEEIRREVCHK